MTLQDTIAKVLRRESLSREEAHDAMAIFMNGQATAVQMAAYLAGLRTKGETVEEIAGSADAMREVALKVHCDRRPVVDSCGTGGDGQNIFNVSTTAAFVVAGAGLTVAKHGNRSVSSRSGSADLLLALGIPVELDVATVEGSLRELGIAFLFAPSFHPAMKYAMPVRKELGVRTIFNLLGPLTNPADADVQLIGVYDPQWVKPVAQALLEMGSQDGLVVHGQGADEIVLSGPTQVAEVIRGEIHIDEWWPEDFGLKTNKEARFAGGAPETNAAITRRVLEGAPGPEREIVCMNAAALIRAAYRSKAGGYKEPSLKDAYAIAEESIDSKSAMKKLEGLKSRLQAATQP